MTKYHLMIHKDLRDHINRLAAERKRDPSGDAAKEFTAVIKAMKALQEGRESEYDGKQLGYGPRSHDLSDCAELKVPVFEEFKHNGYPMGPSHRLAYREFDPLPKVEGGRVVQDPEALPYRQAIAFEHRSNDPAGVTGSVWDASAGSRSGSSRVSAAVVRRRVRSSRVCRRPRTGCRCRPT